MAKRNNNICSRECDMFYKNPSNKTLGDINKEGTCSYCLYWDAETSSPKSCACNTYVLQDTKLGSQYNMKDYCDIGRCLKNLDMDNEASMPGGDCLNLYDSYFGNKGPDEMLKDCPNPLADQRLSYKSVSHGEMYFGVM